MYLHGFLSHPLHPCAEFSHHQVSSAVLAHSGVCWCPLLLLELFLCWWSICTCIHPPDASAWLLDLRHLCAWYCTCTRWVYDFLRDVWTLCIGELPLCFIPSKIDIPSSNLDWMSSQSTSLPFAPSTMHPILRHHIQNQCALCLLSALLPTSSTSNLSQQPLSRGIPTHADLMPLHQIWHIHFPLPPSCLWLWWWPLDDNDDLLAMTHQCKHMDSFDGVHKQWWTLVFPSLNLTFV